MRAKTVIYFKPNGEVQKIKSNAGPTRHNRAATLLMRNKVQPTLGMKILSLFSKPHRAQRKRKKKFAKKLHNFYKNVKSEVEYHAENSVVHPIVGSQAAVEGTYVRIEGFRVESTEN